jgi:hypothetical protein
MKLPFNWSATFNDEHHQVKLTKVVASISGKATRRILMKYDPPFLKPLDPKTQLPMNTLTYRLPPETSTALHKICARRWGSQYDLPEHDC